MIGMLITALLALLYLVTGWAAAKVVLVVWVCIFLLVIVAGIFEDTSPRRRR